MKVLSKILVIILLAGCSPKIQERIVYETDTTFIEKTVHVSDTVFKYKTRVKHEFDSIFIKDTLDVDTLTLESNYSYAKAWLAWPHLKGEIQDKDTTLSFKQDSSRVVSTEKETSKKTRSEVITKIIEKKYVPWWIYLLWGVSIGVVLFVRLRI